MTVDDLMHELRAARGDEQVILQGDTEGDYYQELWSIDIDNCAYDYESRSVGLQELLIEDLERGCSEEDVVIDGVPCVVLSP